jgi:UDP:flavonoid glycosyltransferase YjiC (YdhE family)
MAGRGPYAPVVPRHAVLVTFGSSGDVHPFLGLGLELRSRGWRVTLVTNAYFRELVEEHGLGFAGVGTSEEFLAFAKNPDVWHVRRGAKAVLGLAAKVARETYRVLSGLDEVDVVIYSTLGVGARVFRETHGVPTLSMHLSPTAFRSASDPVTLPGLPPLRLVPEVARPTFFKHFWNGADRYVLDPLFEPLAAFRAELGLEPVTGYMGDWFHGPEGTLAMWPDWFAAPQPDWPEKAVCCGFPLYDERETAGLSDELASWLDAGGRPIAFTPGSLMLFGGRFFRAAVEACERLGRRGLLLTRHDEHIPADLPEGVRHERFAPFSGLLPRCCALVHHGGVGTLSQALAAGLPQVLMPMSHDQPDNAGRLRRLGVAGAIRPARFTGRRLARVLAGLLEAPEVSRQAGRIAGRVEPGLPVAADVVEGLKVGELLEGGN